MKQKKTEGEKKITVRIKLDKFSGCFPYKIGKRVIDNQSLKVPVLAYYGL